MKLADLDRLARAQHGVVRRDQTQLSASAWHRAIASGSLVAIHRSVARLAGTANTPKQQIMAAVLAAGPGALASHRSAALLHDVPMDRPEAIDLIVPTSRTKQRTARTASVHGLDDVCVHRPSDLRRLAPHRIDGIACTNVLRTLVDLGAVAPDLVSGAVGHALTTNRTDLDAIATTILDHGRRGRRGVIALRRALEEWSIDAKPADAVLEPLMWKLVTNYGLPPVEFHPRVGGREVDFRVVGTPIVIECDGWTSHGRTRAQFERDRANDAEFAAHGWIILRFTYRTITSRPSHVAKQIRTAIDRWAGVANPDAA